MIRKNYIPRTLSRII